MKMIALTLSTIGLTAIAVSGCDNSLKLNGLTFSSSTLARTRPTTYVEGSAP
jgi:hypothetical protein